MFFEDNLAEVLEEPVLYGIAFACSPILMVLEVFLTAGITHICLMIVGGNRLGFEATFRVVAYSEAVSILTIFPFCGLFIHGVWFVVLVIIGLYKAHETDLWRALLAVFLPLIACLATCGGLVTALLGLGVLTE
jgi:hypothetical protein